MVFCLGFIMYFKGFCSYDFSFDLNRLTEIIIIAKTNGYLAKTRWLFVQIWRRRHCQGFDALWQRALLHNQVNTLS